MTVLKKFLLPAAALLLVGSGLAQAADTAGKNAPHDEAWVKETAQVCAGCHGQNGVSQTPNFPTIAGQYEDYLVHSLKGYRDGKRGNVVMRGQAQGLTDAQIKALARYYAKQTSPLYTPALD